jgi:hypothetical protein
MKLETDLAGDGSWKGHAAPPGLSIAASQMHAKVNSSCVIAKAEPGPCSNHCLLFGLLLISGQFVFILRSAFPGDIDLKTLINMITASRGGVGWGGGANRRMCTSHCCCSTEVFSSVIPVSAEYTPVWSY